MKKIVMGIAAVAMVASMFAVDFAAKVYMTGSLLSGDDDGNFNVLKLASSDQKDADALVMSVNGEKSGAQFQFWYNYNDGGDENPVYIRSANLWFKPIDQLKIKIGSNSEGTYKETIHWWKDPEGTNYTEATTKWVGKYSSYASVEGHGFNFDINPMDGLDISVGIDPSTDDNFMTFASGTDFATLAYGATVKYNLASTTDLPMSVAVSWRDAGAGATKGKKVLAIGADYGNNWSDGFYGFINARLNFNYWNHAWYGDSDESLKLRGIAFDNYFKYSTGAFKVMARVPFILRGLACASADDDPSYFLYEVKATYAIDAYTPYLNIGSDLDNAGEIRVTNISDDFKMQVKPGVNFNIGSAAIDLAVKLDFAKDSFGWSVPFEITVAF